jgi:hypothetical protein
MSTVVAAFSYRFGDEEEITCILSRSYSRFSQIFSYCLAIFKKIHTKNEKKE